jgi:hypothetical protein
MGENPSAVNFDSRQTSKALFAISRKPVCLADSWWLKETAFKKLLHVLDAI